MTVIVTGGAGFIGSNFIFHMLKTHPDDQAATKRVKEITQFFCSEYFCLLSNADGPALLRKIMKQIDEEQEHEKK